MQFSILRQAADIAITCAKGLADLPRFRHYQQQQQDANKLEASFFDGTHMKTSFGCAKGGNRFMGTLFVLIGLVLFATSAPRPAESPEDQYATILGMIDKADTLSNTGQSQLAADNYAAAQKALNQLAAKFPNWNQKLVNFRLDYLASKLPPGERGNLGTSRSNPSGHQDNTPVSSLTKSTKITLQLSGVTVNLTNIDLVVVTGFVKPLVESSITYVCGVVVQAKHLSAGPVETSVFYNAASLEVQAGSVGKLVGAGICAYGQFQGRGTVKVFAASTKHSTGIDPISNIVILDVDFDNRTAVVREEATPSGTNK